MWYVEEFKETRSLGGGFIGGDAAGIAKYHAEFYGTLDDWGKGGLFVGKDQPLMFEACVRGAGLCRLVRSVAGFGDRWFFMAPVLRGHVPEADVELFDIDEKYERIEHLHDRWARGAVQLPVDVKTFWRDDEDELHWEGQPLQEEE